MVSSSGANDFVERQLDERIRVLEETLGADAVAYSGALVDGVDDIVRNVVESRADGGAKRDKLAVLLTTSGGYVETVARIVETLRHHYDYVEFVIPDHAFSAGTLLALSGNAISMDYYSRLGPIDPQVQLATGEQVPALGYLARYEALIDKANRGQITDAEMAVLLDFDQAELYKFDHARELSITLLKEWLVSYKFGDWTETETRGKPVTRRMLTTRAASIAKKLNDTARWHSHGYGISMEVLRRDLDLRIEDFGANPELSKAVRGYHDLFMDYLSKLGGPMAMHNDGNFLPVFHHHH